MVIAHWGVVEGTMRERYGTTVRDLFEMPWREFRTLFESLVRMGILTFNDGSSDDDEDDAPAADDSKFDVVKDWNAMLGKTDVVPKKATSLEDFMGRHSMRKRVLGG